MAPTMAQCERQRAYMLQPIASHHRCGGQVRERDGGQGAQSDSLRTKEGRRMTNEDKEKRIRQWIDPEERVSVPFLDALDLNATVANCTTQLVDRSIETHVPSLTQDIAVPL